MRRTWGNVTGWPETLARWFWAWAGDPGDTPRGTGSSASGAITLIPDAEQFVKKTGVQAISGWTELEATMLLGDVRGILLAVGGRDKARARLPRLPLTGVLGKHRAGVWTLQTRANPGAEKDGHLHTPFQFIGSA